MLVLATLLAAVVGAATVKEGVSAHASRPSSGSIPPVKNRKPPVQLPEDILYLVLEQLSGSLVFGEAHTALSACELVSHTFHSLVQRHKDEHLVVRLTQNFLSGESAASTPCWTLSRRGFARACRLASAGSALCLRSVEMRILPSVIDIGSMCLNEEVAEVYESLLGAARLDTAFHLPHLPVEGPDPSTARFVPSEEEPWTTLSLQDASPEALEDLAMWPRLQSLSLVHLSSVSDRSVVRMNPPPSLTHLSLLTPSAVHSFTKLFVPYSTVLTSLSIAFPLLSPSPGPSGFSLVLTPLLLLLIKLEKLDLHIFTSRSTYLGAKPLPLDKLLDVHLPNFLARSRSGRFLSSFRVTLAPYTPADTAVLERAWRNKRGALQSLVRFERVRAVDATPLGLGWYDQGE